MADDAIKKIKQIYRNKLRNNKQIQKYKEQILNGEEADRALNLYSQEAGVATAASLIDMSTDSEITKELLDAVLRENYAAVINASRASQTSHNKETVTRLGSPDIGFDGSDEGSLMQRISEYDDPAAGIEAVKNALMLDSQKYSDQYMQRSAGFQSGSGMEVLVSREYDGVGVHTTDKGGGEDCQWCKARCGTDVPYKEAYARGMFERHPGCGCIITYKTKRGVFRQGKGDWQANSWSDITETERNQRISFAQSGDNIGSSLRTPRQREFEAELTRQGANRLHDVILQDPTVLADYTPSSLKTALESHGVTVLDSLGQGDYKGVPFESGGGYRALFGGDGTFRYHPSERSHHGGAYYRLSKQDVQKWYTLDGVEFDGHNGGIGATNKK